MTYTPQHIADKVVTLAFDSYKGDGPPTVFDVGCGTGVFLDSVRRLWRWEEDPTNYIFGCDIDPDAVQEARSQGFKVRNCSFLDVEDKFNIVVGNPPYVRIQNLDKDTRNKVKSMQFSFGDTDLYIAAIEWALFHADVVSVITPSSWKYNKSATKLRDWVFDNQKLSYFYDYGDEQVFPDVSTYVAISVFCSSESYVEVSQGVETTHKYSDVNELFYFPTSGTPITDLCSVKIGLATLADGVFFSDKRFKESYPCVKASKSNIKKGWIIYPYDSDGNVISESFLCPDTLKYLEDNKDRLLLRSDTGPTWYSYGRTQGFGNYGPKVLIPPAQKEVHGIALDDDVCFYISGYAAFPKDGYSTSDLMQVFQSKEYHDYIMEFGKPMRAGWKSVNKKLVEKFHIT